ncbi:hypothetical protein K504DRAFT_466066 [Pleomassaria siparia CBS 279.74]|uniref:Zn(2)-C6 fungal-type domain-containing protein n=1 Tax=Pleomassaria siparia CBS 279.74 TaxID=1314801 RepID=A0A6G1KDW9_9PLEO|nr:hypothetical protein K504DRAFT_466066 [Pleomassaria siparia CBS 279.74]
MATIAARVRKPRTACDQCYRLKERCTRASTVTVCTRCSRLDLVCSTVRPVRPAGRRPRCRTQSVSGTTSSQSNTAGGPVDTDVSSWLRDIPNHDLPAEEKELMMFLLGRPENLECLVMGPSFQAAEQRSLAAPLPAALPILKDAYLAFAASLKSLQSGGTATEEARSTSLRHASSAMKTLRSLPVVTPQDAALCLALGTTLASFVYSAIGVGLADICHYCLSTTSLFLETTMPDPDTEPWQSFLILLEIMDCLVHRQKPTLRIPLRKLERIDRRVGLCLPLLPHYYDLCVISHSLANTTDASYLARIHKQLDKTQAAIAEWLPSPSLHLVDEFDSAEIVNLLAQARIYRLAALLVSHRLRHMFGDEDGQADIWSKEIMMELELARRITRRSVQCVTLPFLVAAVEVRATDARLGTLRNVDHYVDRFTPVLQQAGRIFLTRVWSERDGKATSCWFDSIWKPCPVLHSIDAACTV